MVGRGSNLLAMVLSPPKLVRGMSLRKVSYEAFVFSVFFLNSGKNEATDLAVSQLRGSTIAIISAHVPGQHMWASAGLQNNGSWR